ncbi:uncharacterized protein LOC128952743 [Oppia nitens]|uniref:uncharacterized protein LOC128952743 n=1 Tax=Oppia nitens TaxID=1686743 RepID=UPI0023DA54AC|nr:uncharacterized protein LOC128952743 [Oppia nitens]
MSTNLTIDVNFKYDNQSHTYYCIYNSTIYAIHYITVYSLEAFKIFTDWSDWSSCTRCPLGLIRRIGVCTIKPLSATISTDIPLFDNDLYGLRDIGIPCRSPSLPRNLTAIDTIQLRRSELQYAVCQLENCSALTTNVSAEVKDQLRKREFAQFKTSLSSAMSMLRVLIVNSGDKLTTRLVALVCLV